MYKAHRRRQLQMGSKNCFIAFRKKAKDIVKLTLSVRELIWLLFESSIFKYYTTEVIKLYLNE